MSIPVLSYLIFVPMAGALLLLGFPREREDELRWGALGCSLLNLILAGILLAGFRMEPDAPRYQFVESLAWIPSAGIRYAVGVDGLSVFLIALSALLTPPAMLVSWRAIRDRQKEFYIALLLVESSTIGAFAAQDLFLFYVFWELMLIPMALLIGVWGGERRIRAAIKFVLYTLAGSLPMLLAVIWCGGTTGTFSIPDLPAALADEFREGRFGMTAAVLAFGSFSLAFAIKVPVVPFHTWLPDAHVEAPTAGSVILAGILLKMGAYGFLRIAIPFFPDVLSIHLPAGLTCVDLFRGLGVAGIVYGALMAMAQTDMKKLVAYSSVSHLGFVVLGIFSLTVKGVEGALFQMVSHGLSTGALFLLVGMLYERTHTRQLEEHGGVASFAPAYALALVLTALSSIGLPGLNGFPGELLVLMGSFEVKGWLAAAAGLGMVLGAVYMLGMVRQVIFGTPADRHREVQEDLRLRERLLLAPLLVAYFVLGIFPGLMVDRMDPAVMRWVADLRIERVRPASDPTPARPNGAPVIPRKGGEREY